MNRPLTRPATSWLVEAAPSSPVRRLVICVPFAGAGASVYLPWRRRLPPDTGLVAVRLPGREGRMAEPPLLDMATVVDQLAPAVETRVRRHGGRPWALFGYSLGGLIAYELAASLVEHGGFAPDVLAVGGSEAPGTPRTLPPISWLPDEQFVGALRELGGTPDEVLANAELLQLVLPAVRGDFRILETYLPDRRPPLPCPIVTFRGRDDVEARPEAVAAWARHTAVGAVHREPAGGHFAITQSPEDFAAAVLGEVLPRLDREDRG